MFSVYATETDLSFHQLICIRYDFYHFELLLRFIYNFFFTKPFNLTLASDIIAIFIIIKIDDGYQPQTNN